MKALAITKFESVLKSMFTRSLRKATIESLAKIDERLITDEIQKKTTLFQLRSNSESRLAIKKAKTLAYNKTSAVV